MAREAGTPQGPRPLNKVFRYQGALPQTPLGATPLWNGSFTYGGTTYTFNMIGQNPATSNAPTTIPVDIIPIKIEIGTTTVHTFDPRRKLPNGNTVIENIIASPMFNSGIDFKQGGTDLGQTQYADAFQRGNFWSSVSTNTNYHVLLGTPKVLAEQTIHPPNHRGGAVATVFGIKAGLVDINYYDPLIQGLISSLKIDPGTLPIFVTYDVYLTQGGASPSNCCIGGYHNYTGTNAYADSTYIGTAGVFSQDVSALSHEVGEWMDDPLTNNYSLPPACGGGPLEVGDPLEREANYGGYPYTLNGFTYNLQDLVFLPYFGAPPSTSVNGWSTFQGTTLGVCQNGA